MQIYFHSRLWSYLPRVPILVEGTVYIYIYIYIYSIYVCIFSVTLVHFSNHPYYNTGKEVCAFLKTICTNCTTQWITCKASN